MMQRSLAVLLRIGARITVRATRVCGRLVVWLGRELFVGSAFLVRRYGPNVVRAGRSTLRAAGVRACAVTRRQIIVTAIAIMTILPACVPVRWEQPAPTKQSAPALPSVASGERSKRGNPPFYEVYGVRYHVQDSSVGHRERGVASWYGKKFHGRTTSSGEIYDMYAMTAAHKTLPLPTQVRVTHLGNGRSIILTVNDRGPFVDNRIIDLSYAAAMKLDMVGAGTALVEVEALTPGSSRPTATMASIGPAAPGPLAEPIPPTAGNSGLPQPPTVATERLFLQVGAFGDVINAEQLQKQLHTKGLSNVVIRYDLSSEPALYRVRLGPIADVTEYDALVELMAAMEIRETHLVTEPVTPALNVSTAVPGGS